MKKKAGSITKRNYKISFIEMLMLSEIFNHFVFTLAVDPTHLSKCVASIMADLRIRIDRKTVGFVNESGYKVKLSRTEIEAINYMRNEYSITLPVQQDNAVTKLLAQNI
jgi:hypothetical protein